MKSKGQEFEENLKEFQKLLYEAFLKSLKDIDTSELSWFKPMEKNQ